MTTARSYRIGIGSAVLAALCWGTATVMSKVALNDVSPITLLVLQLMSSVALLWSIIWWRNIPVGKWNTIWRFAWLGLLEPGLAYLLGLLGLADMSAGGATLIQSSEAIMIVIASAILLKARPARLFVVMLILALVGLSLALGIFSQTEASSNGIVGISLVTTATATAAFYVVMSSRIAASAHPISIVAWQQSVALLFAVSLLPAEWLLSPGGAILPVNSQMWTIVILSGIIQYGLAFSLYMLALSSVSANVAGIFLNLTPVFGLAIAFLVLNEKMSGLQIIGTLITLAAVGTLHRFESSQS